jgi:4-hydroxy-4-methyl-2-oxoglutarate aldolase
MVIGELWPYQAITGITQDMRDLRTAGLSAVLAGHAVADVSDACDDLGVSAVRTGAMRPIWPGCPQLTGTVATLTLRPAESPDDDPLPDLLRAIAGLAGQVVLVDLEGRTDVQAWGGVLTACARRYGVLGALVYGAARDVVSIAESEFPTFALAAHPARIRGRLRLVASGLNVALGGGIVRAGDMVVADADGAVFLSQNRQGDAADVADIAARSSARARNEKRDLGRLLAGEDPLDVFGDR